MQNELFWQFLAACSTRTLRLSLKKKNTPPLELPSRSEGGFPFQNGPSRHCCLCFMCSAFFGGVGNSFLNAFRLYCRYNKREGERQHGTEKEPLRSGTPQPPRASLRGQRGGGPDHQRIHHEPAAIPGIESRLQVSYDPVIAQKEVTSRNASQIEQCH